MRLNLGSGRYNLAGFQNWDEDPLMPADRHLRVPPIPLEDGTVEEIYMGHLLEHFEPEEADGLLAECRRVLVPGGRLGVVVPDTRAVLARYLEQRHVWVEIPEGRQWNLDDLDAVCSVFLYSTVQPSRHRWSYDEATLRRALVRNGFLLVGPLAPDDPRISVPAWWNLSCAGKKPNVMPGTSAEGAAA